MSLTWEEKLHKTEQKQEDRRQALERMGISVQSSGIKVIFQFLDVGSLVFEINFSGVVLIQFLTAKDFP
jgi:hypothetical protein